MATEVSMRSIFVFLLFLIPTIAYPQACPCGPDYCQDDPRYDRALASKKAALARNYPAELVALLDRDSHCVARVEQAPDGFNLSTMDPLNCCIGASRNRSRRTMRYGL
jgi:hypothetical protein